MKTQLTLSILKVIQMSIANAVILWNLCKKNDEHEMTRQMCKEVCRKYFSRSQVGNFKSHRHESRTRASCDNQGCHQRTTRFCVDCDKYYCLQCFSQLHTG